MGKICFLSMKSKKQKKKKGRKVGQVILAIRRSKKNGGKARVLSNFRKKSHDEPPVDKFIDEETPIVVDHALITHPSDFDVRDVLNDLDGYRDYLQESRGNGLTYGDY